MPIDVAFKRNGDSIIHNILLEIVDNKNAVVQTILEQHAHVKGTFNFSDVSAFKPTTAGSFKFRATTTDDDKLQPNTKEILFTVNWLSMLCPCFQKVKLTENAYCLLSIA